MWDISWPKYSRSIVLFAVLVLLARLKLQVSGEDIGAKLGVNSNAVDARWRRLKEKLREKGNHHE